MDRDGERKRRRKREEKETEINSEGFPNIPKSGKVEKRERIKYKQDVDK